MKIFIPSFNRAQTLTTPWLLEESGFFDYKIILRDRQQFDEYLTNPRIRPETLLITGEKRNGPNFSREYCRELVQPNEWCFMADDNILKFTRTVDEFYGNDRMPDWHVYDDKWRVAMNKEISFEEFMNVVIMDCLNKANETGAHIVGFAQLENPFFRKKKWMEVGYTIAKAVLLKRGDISWNQTPDDGSSWAMEDYFLTASQHAEYGKVLINKYAMPFAKHYQQGGCGPYNERLPHKVVGVQKLMAAYPDMFRLSKKAIAVHGGEVQMRFTMPKQVAKWRERLAAGEFPDPIVRD
jgi:hypothetical protein